ncbi:DUF6701 domain-containing protein [Propionivibrio limicola]|uniref:DUF6701 domain-containing protein n=1 Tax=Propionivibrio limicola TaxID=167645 RepID=UPI00129095E1|nr:DUF6701 domain-containing protein [Propionivibrio limicola]
MPITISGSTLGSSSSAVNVTGNNKVTLKTSTTIYGNVTAGNWPGALSIDDTSTVHGVCTSDSNSLINPSQYPRCTGGTTPSSCSPPSNAPSGVTLTCVCDNFGRTSLNPSTIFGSDWILSTSDSTRILPKIEKSGYLRLTDKTTNNAKAATVPGIFPAAGNYISVEFKHYAYNGSGADGVAVTFSDYSVPPVPGAYGGSLGYAQKTGINGFAGGWIGVALDEYGNYPNPTEGRVTGPGFKENSVGVRGSGSGTSGYPWLGGKLPVSPGIDNQSATSPSPGYAYQVIIDARNEFSTPKGTSVVVNRDTGSGYSELVSIPNVYTAVPSGYTQAAVPANWQISFTGSTGSSTNIHEISGLKICAQMIFPPSGGVASGFSAIDEGYGSTPLAVQNYLTGHIYMKVVGKPFKLNVAAIDNNQILTTYAAGSSKSVTVKLVDNSDGACVLDSSKANYCSSTCKSKSAIPGGSQTLTFSSSNAGQKTSGDFTLNTAYKNLVAIISDGTTTACSTDSFSVRPTGIASVVSSDATNNKEDGSPIFKAGSDKFSLQLTTSGVAGVASGYTGTARIGAAVFPSAGPEWVAGDLAPLAFPEATPGTGSSTATGSFAYSEVGRFYLKGFSPDTDATSIRGVYDGIQTATDCSGQTSAQCDSLKLSSTWTGIDSVASAGDCVADSYSNVKNSSGKYGCNFGLISDTSLIGRFVPYEFVVVSPVLSNRKIAACSPASAFSYLDEGMGLSFTLKALNGGEAVTKNYVGSLARLPLSADGSEFSFGAAVQTPFKAVSSARIAGSGFATAWPAAGDSSAGMVAFDGTVIVSSLTTPVNNRVTPDGPFTNLVLGIAPVDQDGVRITTYDLDTDNSGSTDHTKLATTTLYFGQLRLIPAIGSERLPLAMRAEILRWNGAAFVPNGDDDCTVVGASLLGLSDWKKNLSAGETVLTSGPLKIVSGKGTIGFSAPGAGNDGSVLLTADVNNAGMSYLGGRWLGATSPSQYNRNPSAVAAFGLYKGAGPIHHFRENY